MKMRIFAAAAVIASMTGSAAMAADYATIVIERPVKASADAAWKRIGGYCGITEWLGPKCAVTAGNGTDVGSIRSIADGRVFEVIVAKTDHSYTYAFPNPNPTFYHGTLAVEATGANTSKIVYTIFYDAESFGEKKTEDRERRTKTFTGGVEKMVQLIEAK
jgi:hypothetical protein